MTQQFLDLDPELNLMPDPIAIGEAYLSSARRIIALTRQAGESCADTFVPASPAWSLRDVLSHVTSVADHAANAIPWGANVQETIDKGVAARANESMEKIASEYEGHLEVLAEKFAGGGPGALVVDTVSHEHDIRSALGPDFKDHSAGLEAVLPSIVSWVRGLNLVGELGIVLRSPNVRALFGGPEVAAEVEVPDDWELFRLLAVRRSAEQLAAYPQKGDPALLLAVTSRYPLPLKPLEIDG